jgi:protein-tyrosine phosphatase
MELNLSRFARYRRLALLIGLVFIGADCRAQQPIKQDISPGIPFEAASVASRDGHDYIISWRAPRVHHILIYAGSDPQNVGRSTLMGRGGGNRQVTVSTLPSALRWYFALVPDHGDPLVIATRSLHLSTAANFRDAGGYRTVDGKWVRMGLAYRSNSLAHLTDDELAQLDRLNIKVVCDLRTAEEIQRSPDRVPQGATDVSADVLADDADLIRGMMSGGGAQNVKDGSRSASANPQHATGSRKDLEQRIYRDFVRLPSAQNAYRSLLERLADPTELPTVFHCTAGKDRTGWAEAVFLTILGVPRSTIVRDYMLTNQFLRDDALKIVRQSMSPSAPSKIVADPAALQAAFDEVERDYGTFGNYLSRGLHLSDATLAAIRQNFLAK